jgi:alkaline phosphatase D
MGKLVTIILLLILTHSSGRVCLGQSDWAPLPDGTIHRIAFGSCAKQWEEQPIWDAVIAAKPDLFLFLGDAIYGDWDGEKVVPVTAESLQSEWGELAAKLEFQRLRGSVPVMVIWDNHDYGKHDGGAEFLLKERSQEIFLDFFGEPTESVRRQTPGIYDARIFGQSSRRVQIILLDTRTFKGPFLRDERSEEEKAKLGVVGKYLPNRDPSVTLLGDTQWSWLDAQLHEPAAVRLICSSTQVIADEKGMDEWGNYPHERERLFELIEQSAATSVVLLSGNVHFAEVSRIEVGSYLLYDFTSSGLTHVDPKYAEAANSYRVAGPFVDLNFGLVEIDWDAGPVPLINLKAISLEGSTVFEVQTSLNELRATEDPDGTNRTPRGGGER